MSRTRYQAHQQAAVERDRTRRRAAVELLQAWVDTCLDGTNIQFSQHGGRFTCKLEFHGDPIDLLILFRPLVAHAPGRLSE